MTKFDQLKNLVSEADVDAGKFYVSGNVSAGKRLRKKLLEICTLTKEARKEIQEIRSTGPGASSQE